MRLIYNLSVVVAVVLVLLASVISIEDFDSKVYFFYGKTTNTNKTYNLSDAAQVYRHTSFNRNRPIAFYFHGWSQNVSSEPTVLVTKAYITSGRYNTLILDWSKLADSYMYPQVASSLDQLGQAVALFLLQLIHAGYPKDRIHCVGHSLGGQLVGYVGRHVMAESNNTYKLLRLTGLDPAGPDFEGIKIKTQSISKNDAVFVDIVHTDAGVLGISENNGTVDFWPNGGRREQPGCTTNLTDVGCSHGMSVKFWAESVAKGSAVSFTSFYDGNKSITTQMGNNCEIKATPGKYSLTTNSQSPYSKG